MRRARAESTKRVELSKMHCIEYFTQTQMIHLTGLCETQCTEFRFKKAAVMFISLRCMTHEHHHLVVINRRTQTWRVASEYLSVHSAVCFEEY